MAKTYTCSLSETAVLFTDDKGNTDSFELVKPMAQNEIVNTLSKEINGRGDVTRACLTTMVELLDNPRFDGYKGKTIIGEKMPKEIKAAISEQEVIIFQPLFYAYWDAKNKAPDTMDSAKMMAHNARRAGAWDKFIAEQRNGGLYGNVKTYSTQYFAYFGKLPCVYDGANPDKSRLMPVSAMAKEIAIAKAANVKPGLTGIAKLLQECLDALKSSTVTESDAKSALPLALEIASQLKAINAGYAEAATNAHMELPPTGTPLQAGDVPQSADKVIANMRKAPAKGKGKPAAKDVPALM